MRKYRIQGGNRIHGTLRVGGAKNAALPILAAVLLTEGKSTLYNCPDIADIHISIDILRHIGCEVHFENNTLTVNAAHINSTELPTHLVCKMRSSILFMGAMLGRCREVTLAGPGGCHIGARPIDFHLKGLRKMGVKITETPETIHAKAENLNGTWFYMKEVSVGATENCCSLPYWRTAQPLCLMPPANPKWLTLPIFSFLWARLFKA